MIRIRSDKARKIVARHLEEHDPEMLRWLSAMATTFGKAEEIQIEYDEDNGLKRELERNLDRKHNES